MIILKVHFKSLVKFAFQNIFYSLIIAAVLWFFGALIFGVLDAEFLKILKDTYIGIYVVVIVLSVLLILVQLALSLYLASKWSANWSDVQEAMLIHKIISSESIKNWDAETFNRKLLARRSASNIVAMMKAMSR